MEYEYKIYDKLLLLSESLLALLSHSDPQYSVIHSHRYTGVTVIGKVAFFVICLEKMPISSMQILFTNCLLPSTCICMQLIILV